MKKLILLTLMSLFAFSAMGQRYYSLAECGNDPLKYIERNYEDNEARYKGKTVAQFVQECELELYEFVPSFVVAADGRYNPDRGKTKGANSQSSHLAFFLSEAPSHILHFFVPCSIISLNKYRSPSHIA